MMYRLFCLGFICFWGLLGFGILAFSYTNGESISLANSLDEGYQQIRLKNYTSEGKEKNLSYRVPIKRVLSTYPGATEVLIQLGLAQHIVGTVASYGSEPLVYRQRYAALPLISAPYVPTREEVLALHPDLVIGWSHHFNPDALGSITYWNHRGINTYIVPATVRRGHPSLENTVYPFIADMGVLFGAKERAETYISQLKRRVQQVTDKQDKLGKKPSVIILQSYGQGKYSLYGPTYIIDDVVSKAGGKNLVRKQMSSVGPEHVLAFDPDYIIYVYLDKEGTTKLEAIKALEADRALSHMTAIQKKRIIPVSFSDVNNGNGRLVDALEDIAAGFQENR